MGLPGLKAVQNIFKQTLHAGVAQILIPVFQRLYKAAHVCALEGSGQLHAELHRGHTMLGIAFTLADPDGQLEVSHTNAVNGHGDFSLSVLYVFHSSKGKLP
jgi:hypothetical protein